MQLPNEEEGKKGLILSLGIMLFFPEQKANCRFCVKEWEIGMEIEGDVQRDQVERLVRELMDGQKGKEDDK